MVRLTVMTAATAILCAGMPSFAANSNGQTLTSKRQMASQIIGCMRKKMAVDRQISYNDAARACKDQVAHGPSANGTLVASDSGDK